MAQWNILGTILDTVKLSSRYWVIIAFASASVLFSPDSYLEALGFKNIVENYRGWFGLAFTMSCAFLAAHLVIECIGISKKRLLEHNQKKKPREYLKNLNMIEKRILLQRVEANHRYGSSRDLIKSDEDRELFRNFDDDIIMELCMQGILRFDSGGGISGIDFSVEDWAWEYIKKNPKLLT